MNGFLRVAAIAVSAGLLGLVLELVRRKRLAEEYSFVWIICALALLAIAIRPTVLERAALAIGIQYPPTALVLLLILFVFVASVSFSVVVSQHRQQIGHLMEHSALLEARVRTLAQELDRLNAKNPAPQSSSEPEPLTQR